VSELPVLRPYDQATAEIAGWRGRCLDLFARGERAIGSALETSGRDPDSKINHLAGQRMVQLERVAASPEATGKQRQAFDAARTAWKEVDAKRAYLAHGVATPLLDKNGAWQVRLDFTDYRGSKLERRQWTASRSEAYDFEARLASAFKLMSAQLGQLRKRKSA
jgi:hypothetical protein